MAGLKTSAVISALTASLRSQSGSDVIADDNNSHVCLRPRLSLSHRGDPLRVRIISEGFFFSPCSSWHLGRMADGPEGDVDDPPSMHFPPLITVSDLPGSTAAGNRFRLRLHSPLDSSSKEPSCCSVRFHKLFPLVFTSTRSVNKATTGSGAPQAPRGGDLHPTIMSIYFKRGIYL